MNDKRRKSLDEAINFLDNAKSLIEQIKEEEEETLENLPDNMKEGDKGSAMQEAIDNLDTALGSIEDASSAVDEAKK